MSQLLNILGKQFNSEQFYNYGFIKATILISDREKKFCFLITRQGEMLVLFLIIYRTRINFFSFHFGPQSANWHFVHEI